jgi:hypothetical protein
MQSSYASKRGIFIKASISTADASMEQLLSNARGSIEVDRHNVARVERSYCTNDGQLSQCHVTCRYLVKINIYTD